MSKRPITIETSRTSHSYDISTGSGLLDNCGAWAAGSLGGRTGGIVIVSNPKVFGLYGRQVETSLRKAGFQPYVFLMSDGERYKNLRSLEQALKFFSEKKLARTGAVIALGGGVVGDLAGFAAAVYMRGIPFLQVPTTLLSMIDSSVGGKTAVNTSFGKNMVGAFYQPNGVLIDVDTLRTLHKREITAGFCEAVKQGAIGGRELFDHTSAFLTRFAVNRFQDHFTNTAFVSSLEELVRQQVAFKADIVQNDETEDPDRTDGRSRKVLNFGHTLAHALEKVTNYRYFRHGEAVGYGILYAAELSKRLELIVQNELKSFNDVVHRAGRLPKLSNIDVKDVFEAFKFDKKSTGNSFQWILLNGIGNPSIVPDSEISRSDKKKALESLLKN